MGASIDLSRPCRPRRRVSGFTLLEVLVSLAVIATLTAIMVYSHDGIEQARRARATQDAAAIYAGLFGSRDAPRGLHGIPAARS